MARSIPTLKEAFAAQEIRRYVLLLMTSLPGVTHVGRRFYVCTFAGPYDSFGEQIPRRKPSKPHGREAKSTGKCQLENLNSLLKRLSLVPREEMENLRWKIGVRAMLDLLLRDMQSVPTDRVWDRGFDSVVFLKRMYELETLIPPEAEYMRSSGFSKYRNALLSLGRALSHANRRELADSLFLEFLQSEDSRAVAQALIRGLWRSTMYLQRRSRFSRKNLERLVSIYEELSGVFEKLARLLVGLIFIERHGTALPYSEHRRRSLHQNLKTIHDDARLKPYALAFSKTIRNAIAHRSYSLSFAKRIIVFNDLRVHRKLRFETFFRKIRRLAALVHVTLSMRAIFKMVNLELIDRELPITSLLSRPKLHSKPLGSLRKHGVATLPELVMGWPLTSLPVGIVISEKTR